MKTDTIGHFDHQSSGNESDTILPIRVAFTTISEVENGRSNLRLNRLINVEVDISTLSHKKIWVLTVGYLYADYEILFFDYKKPDIYKSTDSQNLFCGPTNKKFLLYNSKCLPPQGRRQNFSRGGGCKIAIPKRGVPTHPFAPT